MQTYTQTFAAGTTWKLNVPGKYFVIIGCTQTVNVHFYKHGKKLDLGDITGILAGLECTLGDINDPEPAFTRVEIDVQAGDTVTVGVGNGQVRYNRGSTSATITQNKAAQTGVVTNTNTAVTNAVGGVQLLAANPNRQYLLIQNKDASGNIWVNFGAAATQANGIKIFPGQALVFEHVIPTQSIFALGDIANNANVVTSEG